MTDDGYKNFPQSITEIRGEKANDAAEWRPRDALINALRDLDNGLPVMDIMIVARFKEDDHPTEVRYWTSLRDSDIAYGLGLIERFKFLIFQDYLIK
jgi:hypothetical protein